ncbi:twin-arginine translocase subunit TatB [Marinobacter fuscus]|uniref:Sec-independent protein translocase protein TatB n=1 Tax=Marinobacter fuscus TaxID=2109942 RepID=A0A2T1KER6_9GAMM|nr:Sec-independent protein translocase protein TatB [Marinobacter fuscus]PSF08253.1 twin-arginine translocase subunit TatB [Marinobacter fuscus]
MFDIGFLELLICGVIALLVLGPERLPTAARAAGRWMGAARRLVGQFTSELDRQLKAEELKEELRKAGDIGLDDVEKTVKGALDEAKKYENMIVPDYHGRRSGNKASPSATQESPSASNESAAPAEPAAGTSQDSTPDNRS